MKLQLTYPLRNPIINQGFGVKAKVYTDQGLLGHNGLDLIARHGEPLYASHDGLASFQIDAGGGCGVVIVTNTEFDWENGTSLFKTIYWHLCNSHIEPQFKSPFEDKTGFTQVKRGDLIGYADNTGLSTGDHCHWGLKPCAKGESWGTYYNTEQNNGYGGCISPVPYLIDSEEVTVIKDNLIKTELSLIDVLKKYIDYLHKLLMK